MKRKIVILLSLLFCCSLFISCNKYSKNTKTISNEFENTIPKDSVIKYVSYFQEQVKTNPYIAVLSINLRSVRLREIISKKNSIRLLPACTNPSCDTTFLVIERYSIKDGSEYYSHEYFFKPADTLSDDMRKHGVLCPPPSLCNVDIKPGSK